MHTFFCLWGLKTILACQCSFSFGGLGHAKGKGGPSLGRAGEQVCGFWSEMVENTVGECTKGVSWGRQEVRNPLTASSGFLPTGFIWFSLFRLFKRPAGSWWRGLQQLLGVLWQLCVWWAALFFLVQWEVTELQNISLGCGSVVVGTISRSWLGKKSFK